MSPYDGPHREELVTAELVTLDYAQPARRRRIWLPRLVLLLATVVVVLGTVAILVDVESVLFSGPPLLASGIYLLITGVLWRGFWLATIGTMHVGICTLLLGLVLLLGWSPTEAEVPFAILSVIYCWPALIVTLTGYVELGRDREA